MPWTEFTLRDKQDKIIKAVFLGKFCHLWFTLTSNTESLDTMHWPSLWE